MEDTYKLITNSIKQNFKTAKDISKELDLPYVRVSTWLKKLRKTKEVIVMETNEVGKRGVKPLKYRLKCNV